jgi:TnpA family transposase
LNKYEGLTILSDEEKLVFYELPDFDDEQRVRYFIFDENELDLIFRCKEFHAQVYCAVQIGYFKAKNMFFKFQLNSIPKEDVHFLLNQYFNNKQLSSFNITKNAYYFQQKEICRIFGYTLWANPDLTIVAEQSNKIVRKDATPKFILNELFAFLKKQKIVRPGYTTLQTIVSKTLVNEKNRIKKCLDMHLKDEYKKQFQELIKMDLEIKKHTILKSFYNIAQNIIFQLGISEQNITYYASLIHFYTIHDLKRFDEDRTYLYLLCYVYNRYQQVNDNIVTAFIVNTKQIENYVKKSAKEKSQDERFEKDKKVGKLILLFVDEYFKDETHFIIPRQQAFDIMPKEEIKIEGNQLIKKKIRRTEIQWKIRDKTVKRYKQNLRPLFTHTEFESRIDNNPLLKVIQWMQEIFLKKQSLPSQKIENIPDEFIFNRLKKYISIKNDDGKNSYFMDRYEILVYQQIIKQLETGALHIKNSSRYKPFADYLIDVNEVQEQLNNLDLPLLNIPFKDNINNLKAGLKTLWKKFDKRLKIGDLKHIKYNFDKKEIMWVKPKEIKEETQNSVLYSKLPMRDLSDVLRFVNNKINFMSAFSPLQPRYLKQEFDVEHLIATLMAQANCVGNHKMAKISDIHYHKLESTYQQYIRLATLRKSNDILTNAISLLPIFPHYNFDSNVLFGSFDGQKFEALTPTARARYSKKYYKKGRDVVAYTLLSNYVPIMSELIGAHDHESYFAFDLWYGNSSLIQPSVLTGDMHSINKANFAIFHLFGGDFRPGFSNLKKELANVYGINELSFYDSFSIKPSKFINTQPILDEKENIDCIIATLALKEISQSQLIQKLCLLPHTNTTRSAIFEYDKLIRSIYTLKCILDPTILQNVHKTQNRVESYYALRAAIAKSTGRKALLGQTDLEIEISNECGRLIASCIIYYNASIQSCLLTKTSRKKLLKIIKKSSPIAWGHIHFTGHFTFYNNKNIINLDDIIADIIWD